MKKTLGGDRLGSGNKMQVDLHNYSRSTHDLKYAWRSSMSAGTLVPFLTMLALPGDTFDIDLNAVVRTHPTIGPLFGSYKVQLDVFQAPIRLYQGLLHNNKLGIGMKMQNVFLPRIELQATPIPDTITTEQLNAAQISQSSLLAYLGIRGVGNNDVMVNKERYFNAVPLLAYWDIYKQYYSNKQEEIGYVIDVEEITPTENVTEVNVNGSLDNDLPEHPAQLGFLLQFGSTIWIQYDPTAPAPQDILLYTNRGVFRFDQLCYGITDNTGATRLEGFYDTNAIGLTTTVFSWGYNYGTQPIIQKPQLVEFNLAEIDDIREEILAANGTEPYTVPDNHWPYRAALNTQSDGTLKSIHGQNGLGVKTYQSDIFNNWLQTEWIDGEEGINAITAIDTSEGSFTIDTLNLSKKVYDMLNRIAVSGGTYDDWLDAVYTHERIQRAESPIYEGGLIKELEFQEVVSTAESTAEGAGQPLGTLAGKGIMGDKHKGGHAIVKCQEPSYIIGIISLTPRIDYSQGNQWDVHLQTMDDLHKPALDEIGFQDLITEQMAWWDTKWDETSGTWIQKSAGKQPAWLNYMTNHNKTYGSFADVESEMFMTLNRRYEYDQNNRTIKDLTTYIDPAKYNFIFAQTSIDAQNFWVQIGVGITARRKMSAKIMPNL